MAEGREIDASSLLAFENAAAGHDGFMSDPSGELFIKPSTNQEIDFYQHTLAEHPDFAQLIPTFMGTLALGAPVQVSDATSPHGLVETSQVQSEKSVQRGNKISTETAVVLENLEYGFKHPNVMDLKLGARLYDDDARAEKAQRLDKVAAATTSGSLNFRITGMKVWNGTAFDVYDKFYGRKFNADNVKDGFATFFAGLSTGGISTADAAQLLETIEADITKARHALERDESRMYGASVLIVYEGDDAALSTLMGGDPKTPQVDERAPTALEVEQSEVEEAEDEDEEPVAYKVRLIDFAHSTWTPGQGHDENVIKGLRNIEKQMDILISRFD